MKQCEKGGHAAKEMLLVEQKFWFVHKIMVKGHFGV